MSNLIEILCLCTNLWTNQLSTIEDIKLHLRVDGQIVTVPVRQRVLPWPTLYVTNDSKWGFWFTNIIIGSNVMITNWLNTATNRIEELITTPSYREWFKSGTNITYWDWLRTRRPPMPPPADTNWTATNYNYRYNQPRKKSASAYGEPSETNIILHIELQ